MYHAQLYKFIPGIFSKSTARTPKILGLVCFLQEPLRDLVLHGLTATFKLIVSTLRTRKSHMRIFNNHFLLISITLVLISATKCSFVGDVLTTTFDIESPFPPWRYAKLNQSKTPSNTAHICSQCSRARGCWTT